MIYKLIYLFTIIISFNIYSVEVSYQMIDKYNGNLEENNYNDIFLNIKDDNFILKNNKFHISYNNKLLLLKINVKKKKNDILWVDVLSPGKMILLNKDGKFLDSYGFGNKKELAYFNITKYSDEYLYIIRDGNLRFDGSIKMYQENKFKSYIQLNNYIIFFFAGFLLFVLSYNLGYLLILKSSTVIHYILFNTFQGGSVFVFGLSFNYLLGTNFIEELQMTTASLAAMTALTFARHYLSFHKYLNKKNVKKYQYIEKYFLLLAIANLILPRSIMPFISQLIDLSVIFCIPILVYYIYLSKNTNKISYFYFIAWIFQIVSVICLYVYEYMELASTEEWIMRYSLLWGCMGELICNSFGIAYKNKMIEKEKIESDLKAKDKDKYQNLLRVITHDISTPLATAQGWCSELPDDLIKNNINKSLQRTTSIIESVRKQEKSKSMNVEKIYVKDIFKELEDLQKINLYNKNINFKLDTNVKSISFNKDILIYNILNNLISNSIKFSKNNSEVILKFKESNTFLEIGVKDFGIGMSNDQITKIKQNLVLSTYGTAGENGTGFGLNIIKSYIKQLDGEIFIESEPQKGTFIYFRFNKQKII